MLLLETTLKSQSRVSPHVFAPRAPPVPWPPDRPFAALGRTFPADLARKRARFAIPGASWNGWVGALSGIASQRIKKMQATFLVTTAVVKHALAPYPSQIIIS